MTNSWWRLRQVALVAADLSSVEDEIGSLFGVPVCFRDPGVATFGLRNALWAVGDTFCEVVSPVIEGTTAARYLERRGGDAGYMVILQTDDLDAARRRIADTGTRVVFEAPGKGIHGLHLHPRDTGGALLSLDRTEQVAEWPWAGTDWRHQAWAGAEITAVEMSTPDVGATVKRWSDLLGRPADGDRLVLDRGELRFVAGEVDGVVAVEISVEDPDRATSTVICGTRFELRPR